MYSSQIEGLVGLRVVCVISDLAKLRYFVYRVLAVVLRSNAKNLPIQGILAAISYL